MQFIRRSTVLLGLMLAGCDCAGTPNPGLDGSLDGGGVVADANGLDANTPAVDGGACGTGTCEPIGCDCTVGNDCCSDNCVGRTCVPTGCTAQGAACTVNEDCCTLFCSTAGLCAPVPPMCRNAGSPCTTGDDCCTGNCATPAGATCAGGTDCVCGASTGCRPGGQACTRDGECCNGFCDRPGGAAMGTCALLGACRVAGEPCGTPGFNGACCSTVCLDTTGTGARCQFLGGCRVQDELCDSNGECCSGSCLEAGRTADGRPIMRCANADSCLPAGEVCGGLGASSNCCPNGGGDTGCEPTGSGFRRCFGGENGTCTLPGQECTSADECCNDPYPNLGCEPRAGTTTNVCCLGQGEACAFGDVCCCGVCAPDVAGALVCCPQVGSCTADGQTCTMDSDCCSGDCGVDLGGNMVCSPTTCVINGGACTADGDCCPGSCCRDDGTGTMECTSDCGAACTLGQLGDFCDSDADCCNSPPVRCPTGVEFRTCSL